MTELSGFWTTTGTASGHQQASYTQAQWSTAAEILAACSGFEGVAPGYLDELVCADGGANTVTVGTGGAVVDGKWYKNDAEITFDADDLPSAVGSGNTRIDRIVLRTTWANYECVATVISGTDAASPTAPAITQTSGTTYDIQLCQVLIDEAGDVTVTDERTWAAGDDNSLTDGAVTTAKIAADAVTTAKIPNRTRSFFVQALPTDASATATTGIVAGVLLADSVTDTAYGHFFTPTDYAASLTATAVVVSAANGNIFCQSLSNYGAEDEGISGVHQAAVSYTAYTLVGGNREGIQALSYSSLAAGDYVQIIFYRNAGNASDTINDVVYMLGWLVSYTADS